MLDKMLAAPESDPAHAELKAAAASLMGSRQTADDLKARVLALRLAKPAPVVAVPRERIVLIDDDEDPVISPPMRIGLRERYGGCDHHSIAGGGHYPAILRPQIYESILRARLAAGD
jgi:maspardin